MPRGRCLVDRYGGMDQLKKTIAEDPVGFVSAHLDDPLTGWRHGIGKDLPGILGGRLGQGC